MPSDNQDNKAPKVLIVGAGLGGLLLGAILERANIEYCIFERAVCVKPLGSALVLGPNILPVFEQLGLLEEIIKIALPVPSSDLYNIEMKKLGSIAMTDIKKITGFNNIIFARPRLYELMLKQIPKHKILMNKKVLKTQEKDDQVFIHCSDNTLYSGDILVGADGTYSSVRQNMYKVLEEKGVLPKSDMENFTIGHTCMVGVAEPKDPSKYPQLQGEIAHLATVIGEKRLFWSVNNCPDNQICWMLFHQFGSSAESREKQFRNSEWSPDVNEPMIEQFYDLPCPFGGTMGELIDDTPKDLISKVFVEEKMFHTWFDSRSVLLGDACHKMLPSAGQGAINAMQDAVILANCLSNIVDATPKNIKAAFQDYYDQRYEHAKNMVKSSSLLTKATLGQNWLEKAFRYSLFNLIPEWVQQLSYGKMAEYRPQIIFLPLAVNRGTGNVLPQKPSKRYTEEQAKVKGVAV